MSTDNTDTHVINVLKNIDWQRFNKLCLSIGKDLNSPQLRFMKALFLEQAVAEYSKYGLVYVGDTEQGCDFVTSDHNIRIEMKFVEGCLYSGKKMALKQQTSDIKLMNSNGTNTHVSLPDTYSDYLLIVDICGAGVISKTDLLPFISVNGDGIKAKIPTQCLQIIFEPKHIEITENNIKTDLQIKNKIDELVKSVIHIIPPTIV